MHHHRNLPLGQQLLRRLRKFTDATPVSSAGPFAGSPRTPAPPASLSRPAPPRTTTVPQQRAAAPMHAQQLLDARDAHQRLLDAVKNAPRFVPFRGPQPIDQ